jgi:acetyl esterase
MPTQTFPVLERGTQALIDALALQGGKPIYTLPYAEARKVLEGAQSRDIAKLPADVEDRILPVGPTGEVPVTIFRPKGSTEPLPVVMYCHGGGWVLGSKNTHDRLLRELTNTTQTAFVFINYTLSPEAQFPVPIEQAYAATKFVAEHGDEFGIDGSRMAIAGDGVGGNMAAVVALLAKESTGPAIRYQALFYPVTDANFNTPSYNEFADGPYLTKAGMEWFWDAYAPNKEDRKKITASPLQASTKQLNGLPAALLIVDENDVVRDEGEEYAKKLIRAGVEVTAVRYLATIHDFMMLNALANTPAAESASQLVSEKLSAALYR